MSEITGTKTVVKATHRNTLLNYIWIKVRCQRRLLFFLYFAWDW
jgi:hypothetical protein